MRGREEFVEEMVEKGIDMEESAFGEEGVVLGAGVGGRVFAAQERKEVCVGDQLRRRCDCDVGGRRLDLGCCEGRGGHAGRGDLAARAGGPARAVDLELCEPRTMHRVLTVVRSRTREMRNGAASGRFEFPFALCRENECG